MAFLDPTKHIATCEASSCQDCSASGSIHCHFKPMELAHFYLICFPSFIMAGAATCMNFACPLNGVPQATRELFFACNPVVAKAWKE